MAAPAPAPAHLASLLGRVSLDGGHGAHSGDLADATSGCPAAAPTVSIIDHADESRTAAPPADLQRPHHAAADGHSHGDGCAPSAPAIVWTLTRQAIRKSIGADPMAAGAHSPCFSTTVAVPEGRKRHGGARKGGEPVPEGSKGTGEEATSDALPDAIQGADRHQNAQDGATKPPSDDIVSRTELRLGWQLLLRTAPLDILTARDPRALDEIALFVRAAFVSGAPESCPCCFNRTASFDVEFRARKVPRADQAAEPIPAAPAHAEHPSPRRQPRGKHHPSPDKKPAPPPAPPAVPLADAPTGTFRTAPSPPSDGTHPLLSFTLTVQPPPRRKGSRPALPPRFAAGRESWGASLPGTSWPRVLAVLDSIAGEEDAVLEVGVRIREVRVRDVRKKKHPETGECEADKGGCTGDGEGGREGGKRGVRGTQ